MLFVFLVVFSGLLAMIVGLIQATAINVSLETVDFLLHEYVSDAALIDHAHEQYLDSATRILGNGQCSHNRE